MPADVAALMRTMLHEVFGERDAERRRATMARTFAPGVVFADAEGEVVGLDALDAKVRGILDDAPAFAFVADGPVRVVGDLGLASWGFGPEGGPPVVRGTDVALVEDGRIARLWTALLGPDA